MKVLRTFAVVATTTFATIATAAGLFSPDTKDVCDKTTQRLDPRQTVMKLLDADGISDWTIDTKGNIEFAQRVRAIVDGTFCMDPKHNCAPDNNDNTQRMVASVKLTSAGDDLKHFLRRVAKGEEPHYRLVTGSDSEQAEIVRGFVYTTFTASGLAVDETGIDATPPPKLNPFAATCVTDQTVATLAKHQDTDTWAPMVRGSLEDLLNSGFAKYESLSSATFGADRDAVANKNKYNIAAYVGMLAYRDLSWEIVPYLGWNLKKTVASTPQSGNSNAGSLGVAFDYYFTTGVMGHTVRLVPQYVRDFEDKSKTEAATVAYIPTLSARDYPNLFLVPAQLFKWPWNLQFVPSLNVTVGHVVSDVPNTTLTATGSFHNYGPGIVVRLFGIKGTAAEPWSLSTNATYLWLSGEGNASNLHYSQSQIAYSLGPNTAHPVASVSLKYTTGRDPVTFQNVRELIFAFGFKY